MAWKTVPHPRLCYQSPHDFGYAVKALPTTGASNYIGLITSFPPILNPPLYPRAGSIGNFNVGLAFVLADCSGIAVRRSTSGIDLGDFTVLETTAEPA